MNDNTLINFIPTFYCSLMRSAQKVITEAANLIFYIFSSVNSRVQMPRNNSNSNSSPTDHSRLNSNNSSNNRRSIKVGDQMTAFTYDDKSTFPPFLNQYDSLDRPAPLNIFLFLVKVLPPRCCISAKKILYIHRFIYILPIIVLLEQILVVIQE